jgi:3-deoxy-D-manno-octulosonic-acid transferase
MALISFDPAVLRRFYNLLFPFAFVLLLPGYLRRMFRRGNYRPSLGQRFGFYAPELRARLAPGPARPWILAVSVGEMLVALKLIAALRARCPGLALILSTTTTTGFALARERAGADVEVVYTPIDAAWCVRRAFDALRPSTIIIVDGGLWPNFLWEARARALHVSLANARLSPRSERRWRRFPFVSQPVMRLLDLVCVPETADIARWQTLGVPAVRVHLTGSVKFDHQAVAVTSDDPPPGMARDHPSANLRAYLDDLQIPEDAPILLAGSTHPGEERAICEVYVRLRARFAGLFLIIAPRHAERAEDILAELAPFRLQIVSRSAAPASSGPSSIPAAKPDILLLDTTGELRDWYSLATLVFIGKSLRSRGGQNPVEAIAAGKPVVFGPHMDNFRDLAAELLAAHGAVRVRDIASLELACAELLADPAARARQSTAAAGILTAHAGAAMRTADLLLQEGGFPGCPGPGVRE